VLGRKYDIGCHSYRIRPMSSYAFFMITRTDNPTPPATITAAFFGYLVSTVSALAGAGVVFASKQTFLATLRTAAARQGSHQTEAQLEHAASLAQLAGGVVLVVIAAIYLLLAFRLRAGRNWARVVLTIIVVLQVVSLVTVHGTAVNYVSTGIAIIAMVLSYLPASNEYVRLVKRVR
jgi:hypothetical protein